MVSERMDQRVLGAIRLTDRVTKTPITRPLKLISAKATVVRNASGLYVVTAAQRLERHIDAFDKPPVTPALFSRLYRFEIIDPLGLYLPRLFDLALPRDPDRDHADQSGSLFTPVDVALYPASTAALAQNWSSLRVSVARASNHAPVRGALLRVLAVADDTLLASGLSDERGEALVIVPGVPLTKFADAADAEEGEDEPPVVVNTLPVRLELSLGSTTPWPVNPDTLENNHEANRRLSMDMALSTGRMERVVINVT